MSIIYTSFIFVFSFFNFPLICIYFFILYSPVLLFISTTQHLIHNPPPCARLGLDSSTVRSHHDIAAETDGWSNDERSPSSSKSEELEYVQLAGAATAACRRSLTTHPCRRSSTMAASWSSPSLRLRGPAPLTQSSPRQPLLSTLPAPVLPAPSKLLACSMEEPAAPHSDALPVVLVPPLAPVVDQRFLSYKIRHRGP